VQGIQMMDYNENTTPTFALFCEHTNLHTFKYGENVCMKQKSLEFFLIKRRFFTIKMQEGEEDMHINTMETLVDQLHSIEVNIENEDTLHGTCHKPFPIFL
jgi:hypothetical protein